MTEWFLLTSSSMIIRAFNQWLYSPGKTRTWPPNAAALMQRRIRERLEVFITGAFTSNKCYNNEIICFETERIIKTVTSEPKSKPVRDQTRLRFCNMISTNSTGLRWPRAIQMLQFIPKVMFLQKRFPNSCLKEENPTQSNLCFIADVGNDHVFELLF